MRARTVGLAVAVVAVFGVMPAGAAATDHTVVGGGFTAFLPPAVVIAKGDTITFTNLDLMSHNLQSLDNKPDGAPLFTSGAPQGFFTSRPVTGVPDLAAGTYVFICVLHQPVMRGALRVV